MWRGWKLKHSKDIVSSFRNLEATLTIVNKNSVIVEVELYVEDLNEHLKNDAYRDIKELIERRDFYIKVHNEEVIKVYNDLKENVLKCIKQKKILKLEAIEIIDSDILKYIYNRHNSLEPISFKIEPYNNIHSLNCNVNQNVWIECDANNLNKLEEIKTQILLNFDDSIEKKLMLLSGYFIEIKSDQIKINIKLQQIIDKIETIYLKGNCKKCSNWSSLGQYVLHRIDKALQ